MTASSPVGLWSRTDLRSRWPSLLVLGMLCGLVAGLVAAAVDGANRTNTALARLEARGRASDAVVFASQASLQEPDWSALAQRPEVEQIARWKLVFGLIEGEESVLFAPSDDVFLGTVDTPIVVDGRMFDPSATDEMVVTDDLDDGGLNLGVGDVVHLDAYGTSFDGSTTPFDFTVVGVIHTSLSYEFTGGAFTTPGFVTAHTGEIAMAENAMITLRNGAADVADLRRHASTDLFPGVPVLDFQVTARRVTATTDVEAAMLRTLALIVAVAGLTFVGQALARSAATVGSDAPTLRAIGMSRGQLTRAALLPHALVAGVAAVITVVTTLVASFWFPVGLAGQVDPDRGIQLDVTLAIAASAGVVAAVLAVAALAGWVAGGSEARRVPTSASWLSRLGLVRPLAVGVGIRMALEGRRSGRGASRSAFAGAVAAVAGIVAIVTLDHGLDQALRHPEVAGVAWDATIVSPSDDGTTISPDQATIDRVVERPGLAATGTIVRAVTRVGEVGVPTFTVIDQGPGDPIELVTLSGEPPRSDDEITLGPSTARDLDVEMGDTITLVDGRSATVVGLGLFPADVHSQFDEGALVTNDRLESLITAGDDQGGAAYSIAVRFEDRRDIDAQTAALGAALAEVGFVSRAEQPLELSNLHNMRRLPNLLAVFLALLGIVAVGHALFSSVRRRQKDFAVLRALGITRSASRLVLAAHGSVVAVVGLGLGIPLGLVAGRAGWRAITDRVPLTYRSPVAALAVAVVIPAVVVAVNTLAVLPGRRAARLEPAAILRAE